MVRGFVMVTLLAAAVVAVGTTTARAASTSFDQSGRILLDGKPFFPIVLSRAPDLRTTTPWGTDGLDEVVGAGVNVFKTGPTTGMWDAAAIQDAIRWNLAASVRGAYTWVNLDSIAAALPASPTGAMLARVVTEVTSGPGGAAVAMWKGADEPYLTGRAPAGLTYGYCRITSRGDPTWCIGDRAVDGKHLVVTIQGPRGGPTDLAAYAPVTDVHGINVYPVTLGNAAPDLHQVGAWTSLVHSVSGSLPVWTTLQVCASGAYDKRGNYVLPTGVQERYMVYDAIVNGARALNFYGAQIPGCWSKDDAAAGWNWTFWHDVLAPIVSEISAKSPLGPALVGPDWGAPVASSDAGTQVLVRQGATVDDLWLIAARSGEGRVGVTFTGLPDWATTAVVYREGRSMPVTAGTLADDFSQWDVHVYRVTRAPAVTASAPGTGVVGSRVTLTGTGLAATSAVRFGAASASFRAVSDEQLSVVVPRRARSSAITVYSPGGVSATADPFRVAPSLDEAPHVEGEARVGARLVATTGTWLGDPPHSTVLHWQRCTAAGTGCVSVPGATARSYRVRPADAGKRLRVVVKVRSGVGEAKAQSAPTAVVAARAA